MAIETWSPGLNGAGVFPIQGGWGGRIDYNAKPEGDGWQITGYRTQASTVHPKYGSSQSFQVPIYSRSTAPAAAPASAAAPQAPAAQPPAEKPSAEYKPSSAVIEARERVQSFRDMAPSASYAQGLKLGDDFTDNLNSIAAYGKASIDDYERRFLPDLDARAKLAALEIGDSTRQQVARLDPGLKLPKVKDIYGTASAIDPNSLFSQMQNLIKNA